MAIAVVCACSLARLSAQVLPGQNVNMVAGRTWPTGDPFLQRQDEPSIAVSSRNVLHLLAGANDYRTVDLPGLPADKPTGDAWLGLFKSFDGGKTWQSNLLPGYPQDNSAIGLQSPLHGYDAGADPLVRAGANGLFFYSGIVFQRAAIVGAAPPDGKIDRKAVERERERQRERKRERDREKKKARKAAKAEKGAPQSQPDERIRGGAEEDDKDETAGTDGTKSAIFVSTLIDLNNTETGDPIAYVRTSLVDQDTGGRFLDKQWMAVDVPRAGAPMCVINVPQPSGPPVPQSFPAGRIYVVYTAFTGSGSTQRGQILFSSSSDCGQTWSRPKDLTSTQNPDVDGNGLVNVADVNLARLSYQRACGDAGFNPAADVNGDCIVDATDLTLISRAVGKTYPTVRRIPQGANVTVNPITGAVYVAWREFKAPGLPDAIQFVQSTNFGASFTAPVTVSTFYPYDQGTTDTSFRTSAFPTLASDGQRIYLAWAARNFAKVRQDPTLDDARIVMSTSTNGSAWTPPRMVDDPQRLGHQIMPALTFGAGKLSLLYYDLREDVSQLYGPFVDERPILTSNPPGLRHTLDVRIAQASPADAPQFQSVQLSEYQVGAFTDGGPLQQLQFNPPNLPIFRQGTAPFIGDYIDLATSPTMRANPDGTWSFNIEPSSAGAGHAIWTDNRDVRPGPQGDLSQYTPPNSASRGSVSLYDPTQPLPACNPDFTGTRDQNIYTARFDQGLFAAAVNNSKELDGTPRAFALLVENAASEIRSYRLTIANQPPGGRASFDQFSLLTSLDVAIPPHSTIARTAYVSSTIDPSARVTIDVAQIPAPGGQIIVGGQQGSIVLNGDPSAPRIENGAETYDPLLSAAVASPRIENPRLENPRLENPRIENVSTSNVGVVFPRLENPAIENPRIENPRIENPRLENPRIENATIVNGTISDTTWELTNTGNATAVYAVKLLLNQPVPPTFETELVIHKTYTTPTAVGCDLRLTQRNVIVTNITTPAFSSAADVGNPRIENPAIENATVALAPGESANITLRVFDPNRFDAVTFDAAAAVTPAAVSQAVNTDDAAAGVTQPPVAVAVSITTPFLADAPINAAYAQTLQANVPGTWAIVAGALPPGLTLNGATGQITGTATTPGTFAFTVQFTDTASPPHTATHDYVIHIAAPLQIATTSLLDGVLNVAYADSVAVSGGVGTITWAVTSGALPAGLAIDAFTGRISGTPTAIGTFTFTVTVSDQALPNSPVSRGFTIRVTDAVAEIDKAWVGGDTNWSNAGNWSPAGVPTSQNNVVIPANAATQPTLTQDSVVGSLQVAPGATLDLGGHTLRAFGSVDGGNTIVNGTLQVGGEGVSVAGTVPNLDVVGPLTFVDFLHVTGNLTLHGGPVSLLGTHHSVVDGSLIVPTGQATLPVILGGRGFLAVGGLNVDGLVLDSATLVVNAGPIMRFDRVLFQNFDPTLAQLSISGPGAATPFTFNQLIFTTVPTTGFYISANDSTADGNVFTINLVDAQATDGPAHTETTNGAVVNWPAGASADLAVTQFDAPDLVQVGNNVVYTISITNNGPDPAVNVVMADALPQLAGTPLVTLVSAVPSQGTCVEASGVVSCSLGNLAAGGTISVSITVTTLQTGTISNAASAASNLVDPNPTNSASVETTTVQGVAAAADLAVSKSHAPPQPIVGQTLTYSILVQNNGPSNATGVVLTDTLPPGVTFVSASDETCAQTSGTVTCQLGAIANGATRSVTIVVTPTVAQPITNTASVSGVETDPNTANNTASDQAMVLAFGTCSAATFSGPRFFPVGPSSSTILATGDFNGDGRIDAAVTESGGNQVAIMLGDGVGGFGAPTHVTVGASPSGIVAADFNHDGRVDLAVNNRDDGSVSILLGDGLGGFGAPTTMAVQGSPFTLEKGDLNQDGNVDLVIGDTTGSITSVTVLLGDGAGHFGAPVTYASGPAPTNVVLGDFDGDGHLDIAVPNTGANTVSILKGNGDGSFAAPTAITLPNIVVRLRGFGDVNGDGRPDLGITTGTETGTDTNLVLLLNTSTVGTFTFAAPTELLPLSAHAGFAATADLNGDGHRDLVATSFATSSVTVMFGDGTGAFGPGVNFVVGPQNHFELVDVNGDGRLDVIGTRPASGDIYVLLNVCGSATTADVTVSVSAASSTLNIGDSGTGTATITNHGPNPATNVTFIGSNAGHLDSFVVTPSQGTCGGNGATTCSLGTIAPNASATISFSFVAVSSGATAVTGSATANEADPTPLDNFASAAITVNAGSGAFVVTNTNDSGTGSLRQAISNSNSNPGFTNRITFNVGQGGPISIAPLSPLPTITVPVVIDGTTQPGFAGSPIVELNGAAAGPADGLSVSAGGSTIRGLVINRFRFSGINLFGSGGNVVEGNYIGTNAAGTLAQPNGQGIQVSSPGNTIGGVVAGSRNVISGNGTIAAGGNGINVSGPAVNTVIVGNFIGLDAAGSAAVPNTGNGICLCGNSSGTTVGGAQPGAGNVISGNGTTTQFFAAGINIVDSNANVIAGNRIGTNPAGTAAIPNASAGISGSRSNNNVIGGFTVAARNLISGNGTPDHFGPGVILNLDSTGNQIVGNWIGVNASGNAALGNQNGGVFLSAPGNFVGGTAAGAGNVIAGNTGIGIALGAGANGTVIQANVIGANAAGDAALGNSTTGINISDDVANTIVGGTVASARNIVSGNGGSGISVGGASINTQIFGNFIGTNQAGMASVGNGGNGVTISGSATGTLVGSDAAGAGNLISGNGSATTSGVGVAVNGTPGGHIIRGNRIGTNAAGTAALPNRDAGVRINNSNNNVVGGTTAAARNIISGNGAFGVAAHGIGVFGTSSGNMIQGNYVGLDGSGTSAIPNSAIGIQVGTGSSGTLVGGATAGAGNVVSGNGTGANFASGVDVIQSSGNTIQGNRIGTDASGNVAIPNKNGGVNINTAANNNTVGGSTAAERNVISGNLSYGVNLVNGGVGNKVVGNFIGVSTAGATLANSGDAVIVGDDQSLISDNVIQAPAGRGVVVTAGTGNGIFGNAISNAGIGIDLGGNGVTPNDAGDADAGPNDLQNFPSIGSAAVAGGTITIAGTLNSAPNDFYILHFYASAACDASGHGPGATFLGELGFVNTDLSGNAAFSQSFAYPAGAGTAITATATHQASGSTSEFSQCVTVGIQTTANLGITKNHASTPNPVLEQPLTYTITVSNAGPDAAPNTVVTDMLPPDVNFGSATSTIGSCTESNGTVSCALGTLASGASATITLVVTPEAARPLTNTASVSSSATDPTPANNTASDVAMVVFGPCATPSFFGPDNTTVSTAGNATAVALADFNHDGMTDGAATESSANQIAIVLGQNGPDIITHVAVGTNPISIVTADFNNDGNADLAVANQGSGNVSVLLGDGQGGFSPVVNVAVAGAFGLVTGDLNQDGFADLLIGPNTGTNVSVLLWNATTGAFNAAIAYAAGGTSPNLVLADFDGDAKLDVIAANRGANTAAFLKGDGLGAFAAPVSIAVGAPVVAVRSVGDVDGDGRPDLGVTTGNGQPTNTNLMLLLNGGAGTFGAPTQILAPSVGVTFVAPADFNGDGKSDLAVTSSATGSVLVLLGNGDGTFTTPTTYAIGSNPGQFVIHDVDGDGRLDIVGGRGGSGDVWIMQNLCGSATTADLALTASATSTVVAGQNTTVTIEAANHSATTLAENVVVSLAIPPGASPTQGGIPQPCGISGATITCSPGDLAPNATASFTLTFRVVGAGAKVFTASVTSFASDPNPADNAATATTTVTANALTFTVTNTNDSGPGSLRGAIANANANSGSTNTITFNIPGAAPFTITPLIALPTITTPVVIDGTTQPGFSGTPIIELSGATAQGTGLRISAGGSIVRGLVINRWGTGIQIDTAGGNTIVGNYIGTDVAGSAGIVTSTEDTTGVVTRNPNGNGTGIRVQSPNNLIGGTTAADRNVISGNSSAAIDIRSDGATGLSGTGTTISGNYIGTNAAGTAANPNGSMRTDNGVPYTALSSAIVVVGSPNVTIGGATAAAGNVISGNTNGIDAAGPNTIIQNNLIGTNASASATLRFTTGSFTGDFTEGGNGIWVGTNTTIGPGNVIAGQINSGIVISGSSGAATVVANFIGTNSAGASGLGNGSGIMIAGGSNFVIGGPTGRNVISGNGTGVSLRANFGTPSSSNQIVGNYIGVAPDGATRLGNGTGVEIVGGTNNLIGGAFEGGGNVISGNGVGVFMSSSASGNIVQGNLIGTGASGAGAVPNTTGVSLNNSSNNTIGGTGPGAGNVIRSNSGNGVTVASGTGNAIRQNEIDTNGGLGIDLGASGVTANDTLDGDAGANNLQNFPTVAQASVDVSSVSIVGSLNSVPSATFALDFFANASCDASGNGEGATLIGSFDVTTDGTGNATFSRSLPFAGAAAFVTATATDALGNTSEFSACRATTAATVDLALRISDAPDPVAQGQNVTYTYLVTNNGTAPATNVTLIGSFGPGLTFVSATNGCQFGSPCGLGTINPGASGSLSVTMRADAAGNTFAAAAVTSDVADANDADNGDSEATTVTGGGPQAFVVTNTNDTGAGSLRQALIDANLNPGADTVTFNIPGAGVHTITPALPLPAILERVTIDATTQPGWTPTTPVVELNGTNAGATANGLIISGAASGATQISGLVINRFGTGGAGPQVTGGAGIAVQGAEGVRLLQNVIGLDPSGTIARGNRSDGIVIDSTTASASGFFINASVISGNGGNGITIAGATASAGGVIGNRIGTDGNGQTAIGNGLDGVSISGVTDGGTSVVSNTISGNRRFGVSVVGNASENSIFSNTIGANLAGTVAVPNDAGGVFVDNSTLTIIGQPGLGNTIAFNNGNGVSINSGTDNFINSNSIFANGGLGIDLAPTGRPAAEVLDFEDRPDTIATPAAFPTSYHGITWTNWLEVEPVEPRGYVQNGRNSIFAAVSGARFTFAPRSFLGARFSRSSAVFSPGAVFFELYSEGELVATSPVLPDNAPPLTFLRSGHAGLVDEVRVISQGSSMTPGGAAWIMDDLLFGDGPTENDGGDGDAGANDLQNAPVIHSATETGAGTVVDVTLSAKPNTAYVVEFFSNDVCDPSGFGQGRRSIGVSSLAGNASGEMTLNNPVFTSGLAAGQFVTATAQETATGNTSEFSNCMAVQGSISLSPNPLNLVTNSSATVTATLHGVVAGPNGETITLNSSDPVVSVPASVTIPANGTSTTFTVTTGVATGTAEITATGDLLAFATAQATVALRTMSLGAVSSLVGVGHTLAGTITLAQPPPAGGVTIHLASSNTAVGTVTPADVVIAAGVQTGNFTVNGVSAGGFTITASAPGFQNATLPLTSTNSSLISLGSGVVVAPGNDAGIALSIGVPAPPGGLTVSLSSSDPAIATVTPSVFIPQGLQIPAANPSVHGVAIGQANITATAAGLAPDTQGVAVTVTLSFSPTSLTVIQGRTANITLNVSAPAPPGGLTLATSLDNTSFATVPPSVQVAAGTTSVQVPVTGVAIGATTLRASAPGIAEKTAAITISPQPPITVADQTIGQNLEVAANVFLGAAAPAGGVEVTVTSLDPSKILLATLDDVIGASSIVLTIAAGTTVSPAFYVHALAGSGTAQFQTEAPGYVSDLSTVTFQPSGFIINAGNISTNTRANPTPVRVDAARLFPGTFVYQGSQSLRGGFAASVVMTSSIPAVGTIANSPLLFGGGDVVVNGSFQPVAPGTTTISIEQPAGFSTPSNFTQITATVEQPAISVGNLAIGRDLQSTISASLGAPAPAGNLQVTVTSADPSRLLLARTGTEPGAPSITLQVNAGSQAVPPFYVQALASTGTADFQMTAPGYAADSGTVTFQPSGFILNVNNFTTTTFSANTSIRIDASRLDPVTLNWQASQELRAGLTASVAVTSSNTGVGTIVTSPVVISGGTTIGNAVFDPVGPGTTTIAIAQPPGFSTPGNFTQITATVTAPAISISNVVVGRDLQTTAAITLGATPPDPVTVTVTSSDGALATITKDGTVEGGTSLTFTNVTSTFIGNIFVQGRSVGTTTLTVTAPGYNDGTGQVRIDPSGFILNAGNFTTSTFSANTSIRVDASRLDPATLNYSATQTLRGGLTVSIPVTSSDTNVGTIITSPLVLTGNNSIINATFDPLSAGSTTIAVVQPAGFTTPANFTQLTATVTAPNITITNVTVGRDLQTTASINLAVAPPSPETVTVTSSSGALATITKDGAVEGGTSLTFTNVSSTFVGNIVVQGRSVGTTTVTVQAPGYNDGISQVRIDPSGFILNVGTISTTTFSPDSAVRIDAARLDPTTLNYSATQALRAGLTASVGVTSSNTTVGTIVTSPVVFAGGTSFVSAAFHPAAVGTTTIAVAQPPGFSTPSNLTQITATVTAPRATINNVSVGRDLQTTVSISLDVAPPNPVIVTVTSGNGAFATIATNGAIEGGTTVTFTNVTTQFLPTLWVQGRTLGTTTLTVQAPGYTSGTAQVTINPSGFILNASSFTTTASAANGSIRVDSAMLDPTTLNYLTSQAVRGGLTVPVTVTSSNPGVGAIVTSPVQFTNGVASVTTGFDPQAPGTTVITVEKPQGFDLPSNFQQITVTVNP